jgi:dienelactone hydrolase
MAQRHRRLQRAAALLASLLVGSCAAGCTSAQHGPAATLTVTPRASLVDGTVSVSVSGLPAGARTTVTARATDTFGVTWSASAKFKASPAGTVSLGRTSSGGSYVGVNPMGLFELMTPLGPTPHSVFVPPPLGFSVTLSAVTHGRTVASGTVYRRTGLGDTVEERPERPATAGFYGNVYLPVNITQARPAVLVFGGAEGGLSRTTFIAQTLAARGYPAMALAYFHEPGLPKTLSRIPLEYFVQALKFLATQPGVDRRHLITWGISRGSEAALLLGVNYPQLVHGVIAGVPDSHVDGSYPSGHGAAWTLHGKPLPAATSADLKVPIPLDAPRSVIAVEKINGPVMTICGGQDKVWPSCAFSREIASRRHAHLVSAHDVYLRYAHAGDVIGQALAFVSAKSSTQTLPFGAVQHLGGSLPANARAGARAHAQVLSFLAAQ